MNLFYKNGSRTGMIYCILVQELLCNKEMHAGSCVHPT